MAAAIEERYTGTAVELIESSGGRFEVVSDGKLIFSKKQLGRHALHEEVIAALDA